jgi:hypothetical protein
MKRPSFSRDTRGFSGAEKALLICFALAAIVLLGGLLGRGSDRAAQDAERALRQRTAQTSGIAQTLQPMSAGKTESAGTPNGAGTTKSNPPLLDDKGEMMYSSVLKKDGKIYKNGPPFIGTPSASDVSQGAVGDCYFLASLAALAKTHPELVKNMISGPDKDGYYEVTFYTSKRGSFLWWDTGGDKTTVRIKGDLPVYKSNGEPAYAKYGPTKGDDVSTWVALIEKAWAQHKGGYSKIDGGYAGDAQEALTGWPSESFEPSGLSKEDGIKQLREAQKNGWPIVADILNKQPGMDKLNLVSGHSYTVLDVREDGSVLLRNPWGFKHPGTANDGDPPTYISYEDFQKYYNRVVVNHVGQR